MTTGEKIREARKKRGLTQQQLADELGVHRVTVVRWESGAREPMAVVIRVIERIGGGKRENQKVI